MASVIVTTPQPVWTVALLVWVAACASEITGDRPDRPLVEVTSDPGEFLIRNLSDEHTMTAAVIEMRSFALIDPLPCERREPRVPPAGEMRVAHGEVIGFFEGARTAVVSWCLLERLLDEDRVVDAGTVEAPFSQRGDPLSRSIVGF